MYFYHRTDSMLSLHSKSQCKTLHEVTVSGKFKNPKFEIEWIERGFGSIIDQIELYRYIDEIWLIKSYSIEIN